MELPVVDAVEQAISKSVNSLVGNNDVNLNTIVKMAMLNDYKALESAKIDSVISAIRRSNEMEQCCYEKEMGMTYDNSGNLITVYESKISTNDIVLDVSSQGNISSKLSESGTSK